MSNCYRIAENDIENYENCLIRNVFHKEELEVLNRFKNKETLSPDIMVNEYLTYGGCKARGEMLKTTSMIL